MGEQSTRFKSPFLLGLLQTKFALLVATEGEK